MAIFFRMPFALTWQAWLLSAFISSMSFAEMASLHAQTLSGLRIGDDKSSIEKLGSPNITEQDGPYTLVEYEFSNGNELHITISQAGKIAYMELDWGGKQEGARSDFPGFSFGTTNLDEIMTKFGSTGMTFSKRPWLSDEAGGIVMLNSYEVGTTVLTVATKVDNIDLPAMMAELKKGVPAMPKYARLVSLILADADYVRINWGERTYDKEYKKIELK